MNYRTTLTTFLSSLLLVACTQQKPAAATSPTPAGNRTTTDARQPAIDGQKARVRTNTETATPVNDQKVGDRGGNNSSATKPMVDQEKAPVRTPGARMDGTKPVQDVSKTGMQGNNLRYGGPNKADSLFFTLERTPCFGTCKSYRINVYRSGYATFEGRANVEKEGLHDGYVRPDSLERLMRTAEKAKFWTMQDKYDSNVTDLPSSIIRIAADGKDKKVIGRVGVPPQFTTFFSLAEEMLYPIAWKPVPKAE